MKTENYRLGHQKMQHIELTAQCVEHDTSNKCDIVHVAVEVNGGPIRACYKSVIVILSKKSNRKRNISRCYCCWYEGSMVTRENLVACSLELLLL